MTSERIRQEKAVVPKIEEILSAGLAGAFVAIAWQDVAACPTIRINLP
jgi:hypothetical protein